MTCILRRLLREEGGATLAVTAVMMAAVMSMLALAIDMGQLYVAKTEAQGVADAAALAGASAFINFTPATSAVTPAHDRAMEFATMNFVRHAQVDSSEVQIEVDPTLRRVWVQVERQGLGLWFAKLFGDRIAGVKASAVAHADNASQNDCLAPLALPDWWEDANGDTDGDNIPDSTETWTWGDDPSDYYERYNDDATLNETGLGSLSRTDITRDQGRTMIIKAQNPSNNPNNQNPTTIQPGWFYPVRLPLNQPGTTNQGADDYRESFWQCRSGPVVIGDTLDLEMGNMKGPTRQAIDSLVAMDSTAYYDPATHQVVSPYGWSSPRILTIMLFDPILLSQMQGNHTVSPNNFGLFFVEDYLGGNQESIVGRFLKYAQGTGGGTTGSLVLQVQLIK